MEIKKNENNFDRFIKILVGSIVLYFTIYFHLHIIATALLVFAALWMVITGIIGYCPLYHLLGINTERKK
ncbi:MAG: DUF2892 domain-containing protein [Candidatus Margulisiibacteriota bacterium]